MLGHKRFFLYLSSVVS